MARKRITVPKALWQWTMHAQKQPGIATEATQAGGLGAEVIAQGVVAAAPGGEAVLTARADGALTRIVKQLGDSVSAGETVAYLESRDAGTIAAERSSASARLIAARAAYAREKKLFDARVTARQDLEAAQADASRSRGRSAAHPIGGGGCEDYR